MRANIVVWSVAGVAALAAAAIGVWAISHDDEARHDDSPAGKFVVVSGSSLTWDDVRAIQTEIPGIVAAPYRHKAAQLVAGEMNWQTEVVGTTPEYFAVRGLRVAAGDRFEVADRPVVVLGDTVVKQLYGSGTSPVGEVVRIRSTPFTIVGVLAHQGMSPEGQDLDDVAVVPIELFASRLDSKLRFGGMVFVSPATARVEAELRSLLRDRHRLGPGADDDFELRKP